MKKILSVLLLAALLIVPVLALAASASTVPDKYIRSDMVPTKENESRLQLEGATIEYNRDGSVTFTLTAATAKITYTMIEGGTAYAGNAIDLNEPKAYAVVDYGTTDGVSVELLMHYTRKDKDPYGDLYLDSMRSDNYKDWRKALVNDEAGQYCVWDWGGYVLSDAEKKVFDDKIHSFGDWTMDLSGRVGAQVTIYTIAITSTDNAEDLGLGEVRPEPAEPSEDPSSEDPSSEEPSSEEPSSEAPSEETTSEESTTSTTSSEESTTSTTSTVSTTSTTSSTTSSTSEGGSPMVLIIGIIVAVVAVVVIVVVVIVVVRKKK